MSVELDRFIDNTIDYAKKEKGFILGEVEIPKVKTNYANRHVLVVVRGQDYKARFKYNNILYRRNETNTSWC